ncbi:RsmB/NOP family class I SAM-dependent RNA methyltransferase [Stenoxybacter acetivorans]|uniref:RsmB/NOP family class I SAM-dependent RNA methyltransferase n=1 Tax=Stenoxybacter acetivorans TaxID=422441 RepID=UPI0005609FA3|nr:RsmB/NOP family class I SAM-dependent RNA methyltransferase [Stenoxybacter acetivorans]
MNSTQLAHTTDVLSDVLLFRQPADVILSAFFRRQRKLGRQDRHEIAETVFAALRHLQKIQTALKKPHTQAKKAALAALVLGRGVSVQALSSLCNEEESAWLSALKSQKNTFADALNTAAELPVELIAVLRQNGWQDDAILAFGKTAMQNAPLDVRVNILKARRDAVLAQWQAEDLHGTATPLSPWGIRFADKPAVNKHPLFLDGSVEVQDEGSQLLALLTGAKRGQMIVDFCAGAGGKTLAVGAMMNNSGRLYAFDTAEKRLNNLKPRMIRAGLTNIHPQRIDDEHDKRIDRLHGKADCVLVDAPCSGLGTLRRNPDLKYRQSAERIAALCTQQYSILSAAAQLVRIGGRLVYATCSVLPDENERQAERFLAENPSWKALSAADLLTSQKIPLNTGTYLRLNTAEHHTDGFFAAVFERVK